MKSVNLEPKKGFFLPPALFIGLVAILLPIFIVMTADRVKAQKQLVEYQLKEKGISLIRTFEAGTRAGMFNMRWGAQRIQTLLSETALQPDVVYVMITSRNGKILSHSDESRVGETVVQMPEDLFTEDTPENVVTRILSNETGQGVFEVYKPFAPLHHKMKGKMAERFIKRKMDRMTMMDHGIQENDKDWSHIYHLKDRLYKPKKPEHFIFAGLSMESLAKAQSQMKKDIVFQAMIYFLFVCAGIAAVVIFQSYQTAKASLKRVKTYSDIVIHNMPAGLITTDLAGKVTAMNTAAKNIFDHPMTFIHDSFKPLMDEISSRGGVVIKETTIEFSSEKKILLDLTASAVHDEDQGDVGFMFLFRDLTHIRELTAQVETNRRLAAIGKLAAGVAHEIRNPLSSIKGFATYFGKRYENDASDHQTAQIMVKEVERINRSITQLLEFAKPMAIERSMIRLESLVDHSLKLVEQDLLRKKISAKVEIDSRRETVFTDKDRLNQVLLNLYMNAIEAMESDGGRLEVRVTDRKENHVEIRVRDNGCGIGAGNSNKIFEPYYTTRSTGTGLGLSIVHRIMDNLEGGIRVESDERGTCFILHFPAGEDDDK